MFVAFDVFYSSSFLEFPSCLFVPRFSTTNSKDLTKNEWEEFKKVDKDISEEFIEKKLKKDWQQNKKEIISLLIK